MQLHFATIRPASETLQIQSASTLWWCSGDGARAVPNQVRTGGGRSRINVLHGNT